jgi:murein DD-endopeptidase MepM/ murein hydrolase activator NlpD
MKHLRYVLLIWIVLIFSCKTEETESFDKIYEILLDSPVAAQGEAFVFSVPYSGRLDILKLKMVSQSSTDEEDIVLNAYSLYGHSDDHMAVAIVPIPSDFQPGQYQIVLNVENTWERRFPVMVKSGEYPEELISLNSQLTRLVTVPDPRKAQESRELTQLLYRKSGYEGIGMLAFTFPLAEIVRTSPYGMRRTYKYSSGYTSQSFHNGQDYRGEKGVEIFSPMDGLVVMAKERIVTGNTVVLEHAPGIYSLYYHMDSISVDLGQIIRRGDRIGRVGATGLATGPHLHWELRIAGIAVNPEFFLIEEIE